MQLNLLKIYESVFFEKVMFFLIVIYSFFYISSPDLIKDFYNVFLLFSLPVVFLKFNFFKVDRMFWFLSSVVLIQTLSWGSSIYYFSGIENDIPKIDRLAKLFGFVFIAYWLKGSNARVILVFSSCVLGFLYSIFLSEDFISQLSLSMQSYRVDFGIKNAQFTSMFSGVFLLIALFFLLLPYEKAWYKKIVITLIILTLISILVWILIISQSRQVWLSIFIVLILYPLIYRLIHKGGVKIYLSYFFILIFLGGVSQTTTIKKRLIEQTFENESSLLVSIINGDLNEIKSEGNGIRINSWIESIAWVKSHPLIGSGPNAIKEVIKQSDKFTEQQKVKFRHLHSFHIEILVAYGILGSLVIYGMYYWLIRSLVLAHRENPELKMFTVLAVCFLIFWIIINFFESFSSRSYGVYVHNIMFGCLYTFYFAQQRKKIEEAEACA
ncbi:O-antigen ligase [Marinomonas sp. MED121]|uniref:O-antigen ligase family protein n=1 Tax=Marinomonas sp. MED121 TaxID=314277 RepID=UPI00006900ED|nr:O-antigen ligase family protein [Marinomonas sp. MED121]EAQ65684.1 O-antigen ligase [Marinomonas sp. MED121]